MMKSVLLFILLSFTALGQNGAVLCDSVVQDTGANVLSAADIRDINQSLVPLNNLGIEPRVVVGPIGGEPTLDHAIADWAKVCRSWQAPNGGWKNNLLIIAVATDKHKYGVKFLRNGILEKPLGGDQSTQITATYMKPLLHDRNYAKAIEVTSIQLAKRIEASRDERYKGTVVNNQATDLSGFWRFLMWLLLVAVLFVAIYYLARWITDRRSRRAAISRAQQGAILARNLAVTQINKTRAVVEEYAATDKDVKEATAKIGEAMDALALLQNSTATDPSQDGLSVEEYDEIRVQYNQVADMARAAKTALNEKHTFADDQELKQPPPPPVTPRSHYRKRPRVYDHRQDYTTPSPTAPAVAPVQPIPAIVSNSTNIVIVNEEPIYEYRDPFRSEYREPVHRESYSGSTDSYNTSRDYDPPPSRDPDPPSQDSGSTSSYDDSSSSYDSPSYDTGGSTDNF